MSTLKIADWRSYYIDHRQERHVQRRGMCSTRYIYNMYRSNVRYNDLMGSNRHLQVFLK